MDRHIEIDINIHTHTLTQYIQTRYTLYPGREASAALTSLRLFLLSVFGRYISMHKKAYTHRMHNHVFLSVDALYTQNTYIKHTEYTYNL